MMVGLYLKPDETRRAVIAIAQVANLAEFGIAIVVRVVGTDPMATLAIERNCKILAGGQSAAGVAAYLA